MLFEKGHRLSIFRQNGGHKDFGNGHFTFEKGGQRLFMAFEKMHRLSGFWKNGGGKDF